MRKFFKIMMWTSIVLTFFTVIRALTIVYLYNRILKMEQTGIRDGFALKYQREFWSYSNDDRFFELIIVVVALLFTGNLVYLLASRLKEYQVFKIDFLLFRPKWILNTNLGSRRMLSVILNFLISIGFVSQIYIPIVYIFEFPGIFKYGLYDDSREILTGIQFYSLFIFWALYGLIGLITWIKSGFKKEQDTSLK